MDCRIREWNDVRWLCVILILFKFGNVESLDGSFISLLLVIFKFFRVVSLVIFFGKDFNLLNDRFNFFRFLREDIFVGIYL